jgi:diacylglycerol O-acyltransferase / wax synthase
MNRQRPPDWDEALRLVPEHHDQAISPVDTAWLRMDSPSNRMMIVGVWILQPGIRYKALCTRLQRTLLLYPRFRQCVRTTEHGLRWEHDADFSLADHVVRESLPVGRAGASAALKKRVAELATQAFHPNRPLWQFHLLEKYQGGSALIVRIHHGIADGVALIAVMQSLVDGGLLPPRGKQRSHGHNLLDRAEAALESWVFTPMGRAARMASEIAQVGAQTSADLARAPLQTLESGLRRVWATSKWALHGVNDMAAMALMPDDDATRLKGRPSGVKAVAWCEPLPLLDIKAVSKALSCSVNDVLLSCVAGAIGRYLAQQGEEIEGMSIRAMVPVNLRPIEQAYQLGNQFGLAPLLLPIGVRDSHERLLEVQRRMTALKGSMQPLMAFGLLSMAGFLPKAAQDPLLELYSRKTTAVMTNVIGPKEKMRFLGSEIEQSLFWVPQSGSVGLGVSILSYAGGVQFGVISDVAICADPQSIIDGFGPEFKRLAASCKKSGLLS